MYALAAIFGTTAGKKMKFLKKLCFSGIFLHKTGLFLLIMAIVCRILLLTGILPDQQHPEAMMNLHNHTTAETIKLLNDPQRPLQKIMPLSSWHLVGFFRNRQDIFPLEKDTYSPEKLK